MALLYRFTKLNDRHNTGIFTFIVTRSVTRDPHRDATTKDFCYGYHRWAITFSRTNEKLLGVYLILRNPSQNTKCFADFTFTLLNREHFSRNESFTEKQCKFTIDRPAQGAPKWILLSDIQMRKFSDETGEFLLELSLSNITTVFESEIHVPSHGVYRGTKMETGYFTFGSFDWSVSILVSEGKTSVEESVESASNVKPTVFLNRLTSFDNPCRVQYRVVIGDGKHREDSGVLDQISDMSGRIRGFQLHYYTIADLLKYNHNRIVVYVEMHCANTISEAKVPITRNTSPNINCYDRNKQGWCIEADLESEFLRLKLFFMDLHSVPRNHLRYISWITYVVTRDPNTGTRESIPVANSPHGNYYVTDGIDMGVVMDTDIPSQAIQISPKDYLEMEGHLTVHIEWVDSILLFNNLYHKYDDLSRIHSHQMRREVSALQAENYSLERQLFSYQKSISMVSARAQRGTEAYGMERNPYNAGNHHISHKPSHRENSSLAESHRLPDSDYN